MSNLHIKTTEASFENDPDFCSECGAILKIDHRTIKADCVSCGHRTSLKNLIGIENCYTLDFTPIGHYNNIKKKNKKDRKSKDTYDEAGQLDNDRECSKCGHKGMSYTTMQLRSADEGQTIFYFCPKCKHREVENS